MRLLLVCACWLGLSGVQQTSETAPDVLRAVVGYAALTELCDRPGNRPECVEEHRRQVCGNLPASGSELAGYIAQVMKLGDCPPDETGETDSFAPVTAEPQAALARSVSEFHAGLRLEYTSYEPYLSEARFSVRTLTMMASARPGAEWVADGEPIDLSEVIGAVCAELLPRGQDLIDRFRIFESRFEAVPAAQYDFHRLSTRVYNVLASIREALASRDECEVDALAAQGWSLSGRPIETGARLEADPSPATRSMGGENSPFRTSSWIDWTAGRNELEAACAEECPEATREALCTDLASGNTRLGELYGEALKLSRESHYHFTRERLTQLELARELYLAAEAAGRFCEQDAHTKRRRDRYLRHAVELVRLIDPELGTLLTRYLSSRYDVDFRAAL